jgi:hypothetical protein
MMKIIRISLPLICLLVIGCQSAKNSGAPVPLSEDEALKLAVTLANEKCTKRFSSAPFDTSTFAVAFKDGRWEWGGLDVKGVDGFSAMVSFDEFGLNRKVDVFYSTDVPRRADDVNPPAEDE